MERGIVGQCADAERDSRHASGVTLAAAHAVRECPDAAKLFGFGVVGIREERRRPAPVNLAVHVALAQCGRFSSQQHALVVAPAEAVCNHAGFLLAMFHAAIRLLARFLGALGIETSLHRVGRRLVHLHRQIDGLAAKARVDCVDAFGHESEHDLFALFPLGFRLLKRLSAPHDDIHLSGSHKVAFGHRAARLVRELAAHLLVDVGHDGVES